MEFMLSEALPVYSGGLGNVAGDQLKAACDPGVPAVGVELLYKQGYFRQVINKHREQEALFPYNDPCQLPITPVRDPDGEWLRLEGKLPGHSVWLRVWQVQIGRVKLYLLDSNDSANFPAYRGITSDAVNRLHGQVSRRLFAPLFPNWPEAEVPIGHVTNGVHMPSWDSPAANKLWNEARHKGSWRRVSDTMEQEVRRVSDERLSWRLRQAAGRRTGAGRGCVA